MLAAAAYASLPTGALLHACMLLKLNDITVQSIPQQLASAWHKSAKALNRRSSGSRKRLILLYAKNGGN